MKLLHRVLLTIFSAFLLLSSAQFGLAKDEWLQVRSKNFYLVGNASEKDIKKVGIKLEEFRESLRLLFSGISMTSTIPTNVVVFKSNSAFKPFKPLRPDGKTDNFIAGYFQPSDDANYIVVSTEGEDAEMYNTIFHEYVHFIVNTNYGKSEVPPWFNEGLAEYYSTFEISDDQNIKLGLALERHILLLQQSKLIPLADLFRISNRQLPATGDHSRSIFYAESWALVHYLIRTKKPLDKFLSAVLNGVPAEKAFQDTFQMDYAQMETELRKYVNKNTYQYTIITLKNKLDFDSGMRSDPYPESVMNARLGDLLYHIRRDQDAEPYLLAALKLEPDMSMANTTLGMVKLQQRKFDEARQYLEKATSGDQQNPMAFYRYAYLLSRDGRDEFGMVRQFPAETAEKMRQALKRAIALSPEFGESYDLLAFVALVNNDQIDEAATLLQKAIKLQPGNEKYVIRLAELFLRQNKFDQAAAIADKYSRSDDDAIRSRASALESQINSRRSYERQLAAFNQRRDSRSSGQDTSEDSVLRKRDQQKPMSEEDIARASEAAVNRSINEALRHRQDGEKRTLGTIQKIACKGGSINYQIRTDGSEQLALSSKDFQNLAVTSFAADADNINIGCGIDLSNLKVLLTYKEPYPQKAGATGELIAVEIVPKTFRLLTEQEMSAQTQTMIVDDGAELKVPERRSSPPAVQSSMREAMMQNIRSQIHEPGAGEKRELAFLQKIECTNKGVFFNMKTSGTVLRLLNVDPKSLAIKVFTPDLGAVQLECNASVLDFPAVVIYADKPDGKLKTAGTIISLDFVPKSFTFN